MKFLFKKFLKRKALVSKGGAILDQVIAESAAPDNKCLLYKLANFKGGEDFFDNCLILMLPLVNIIVSLILDDTRLEMLSNIRYRKVA